MTTEEKLSNIRIAHIKQLQQFFVIISKACIVRTKYGRTNNAS